MSRGERRYLLVLAAAALALAACGTSSHGEPDFGTWDVQDSQTGVDAALDLPGDVPLDLSPDLPPDAAPDLTPELPDLCVGPDCAPADALDAGDLSPEDTQDASDARDIAPDIAPDLPPPCEYECCDDEACDDGNACTIDRCVDFVCENDYDLCDDDNECTLDSCNPSSGCVHNPIAGCCPTTWLWRYDFEGEEFGSFEVEDLARNTNPVVIEGDAPIVWNLSERRARSGERALYAGDPRRGNYDNGRWVSTLLLSPPLELDPELPSRLSFWTLLLVESGEGIDTLNVSVLVDGLSIPVWAKNRLVPEGDWYRATVDLSAFRGETVQIAFLFDTIDGRYNQFEGVYLDDIAVGVACEATRCDYDSDCNDFVACTVDLCDGGQCHHGFGRDCCLNAVDCRDADPCNIDVCNAKQCLWIPTSDPDCCRQDTDCDDGDPCTTDLCYDHACRHLPSGLEACCNRDGDCATDDGCLVGTCGAGGACLLEDICCRSDDDCDDDDRCTIGLCQSSGECDFSPAGAAGCCERELFVRDFQNGAATGFTLDNSDGAVGWTVHGGQGTEIGNNLALYYGNPAVNNYQTGSSANRGTASTLPVTLPRAVEIDLSFRIYLACEAGSDKDILKVSMRVDDVDLSLWTKDYSTPLLEWIPVDIDLSGFGGETVQFLFYFDTLNGTGNDDEGVYIDDFALVSTCEAKRCVSVANCTDRFGATSERCSRLGTCQYELADNFCESSLQCNDGDICTTDTCTGGGCVFTFIPGCCRNAGECDDGDVCTTDTCVSNRCRYADTPECCMTDPDCDDANPCTVDLCPGVGLLCEHNWIEGCCRSSFDCSDGDPCTLDVCADGICQFNNFCCESDAECDDGDDVCTVDRCEGQRCVYAPTGAPGCCDEDIFISGWDAQEFAAFDVTNAHPPIGWNLVGEGPDPNLPGVGPPYAYYGDPSTLSNYGNSSTSSNAEGTMWSPLMDLPPNTEVALEFSYWLNGENGFDDFELWIEFNGRSAMVFEDDTRNLTWETVRYDLSYAAGSTIRFGFRYDPDGSVWTGDSSQRYHGVFIDKIELRSTCAPKTCAVVADCGQADCVTSACVSGRCVYQVPAQCCDTSSQCDDGNPCTTDTCTNHACYNLVRNQEGCCESVEDCADSDECTIESCANFQCAITYSEDCSPTLPYCQSFDEAYLLGMTGFTLEDQAAPERATNWFLRSTGAPGLSGKFLSLQAAPNVTDFDQCATSPRLDATGIGERATLTLRHYFSANTSRPGDVALRILSSADDGGQWTELWRYDENTGDFAARREELRLPPGTAGSSAVRVALCAAGATTSTIGHWSVDDLCVQPGEAPLIDPLDDTTMNVSSFLQLPVRAVDPDGDPVTLTLTRGPAFTQFTDNGDGTGTLLFTPAATDDGTFVVEITATDGSFSDHRAFALYVVIPGQMTLLREDFGEAADFAAIGWEEWRDELPADANWLLYRSFNFGQRQVARFDDQPADTDFLHRLVSPIFDASAAGPVTIAWSDLFNWSSGGPLTLSVAASDDGGLTWTDVWTYDAAALGSHILRNYVIEAGAVLGGSALGRIAFTVQGADTYDLNYWELTDVVVTGIDAGEAPVWDPVSPLTSEVGAEDTFLLSATDADTEELSFRRGNNTPLFVSIDNDAPASATLRVAPGIGDAGHYEFELVVTDGFNAVAQAFVLDVSVPGSAPVVSPVGAQTVEVGETLRVTLLATDADGQPLSYHRPGNLPGFARLDDLGTGRAILTFTPAMGDTGRYEFIVLLDDTTQYVEIPIVLDVVFAGGLALFGEDFEGAASLVALGWSLLEAGVAGPTNWQLSSAPDGAAVFLDQPFATDFDHWLVSPAIDSRDRAALTLQFRTRFESYPGLDGEPPVTLQVLASLDGGATWLPEALWSHAETAGDLPSQAIRLETGASLVGAADLRLAFRVSGETSFAILSWEVDDVTLGGPLSE